MWGIVLIAFFVIACQTDDVALSGQSQKLKVVATTIIVGDVVQAIGGDLIALNVLLSAGADPHSFEPTPQNLAQVADASIVFISGAGLEDSIGSIFDNVADDAILASVSKDVLLLELQGDDSAGKVVVDPHVWLDPNNVIVWAKNIESTLRLADGDNAEQYHVNAANYIAQLEELDAWIEEQVGALSEGRRRIVTNHDSFAYFAQRYGFEVIDTIFPTGGEQTAPSARRIVELVDVIQTTGVNVIFVDSTLSMELARTIAQEAGVDVGELLYTGSFATADSVAATYIDMMRYNARTLVDALK